MLIELQGMFCFVLFCFVTQYITFWVELNPQCNWLVRSSDVSYFPGRILEQIAEDAEIMRTYYYESIIINTLRVTRGVIFAYKNEV